MFCRQCGKPVDDTARFCANCGSKILEQNPSPPNNSYPAPHAYQPPKGYLRPNAYPPSVTAQPIQDFHYYCRQLSVKEQTSGTIWIVIGIVQVFIGIFSWWPVLIVAGLNIFGAIKSFQRSKKVLRPYSGMVKEYEDQLVSLIITLVYNVLIGGLIGVVGTVYDFNIRNFVLKNQPMFRMEEVE